MRKEHSKEEIKTFLEKTYDVGEVSSIDLFESGLEDTNYFVKTTKGKYVFKIYRTGSDLAGVKFHISFIKECDLLCH